MLSWISKEFLLAIIGSLAIGLIALSLGGPPYQVSQTPNIETKQQSDGGHKSDNDRGDTKATITSGGDRKAENREDEASEYWTLFGRKLKITDTLLVLFTFTLWWATRDLVSDGKESTSRQLRAYVSGTVFHVSSFAKDELVIFKFRLENVGLTPARNVAHHSEVVVAPEPLPADYIFPEITTALSNPANIFPKQSFEGSATATSFFTTEQTTQIIGGTARIYCCGEIFYEDVFGKTDCKTAFCAAVVGDVDTMKKLANGYRKTDLKIAFQIARTGNSDT
jgi:hypothetical protein